MSVERGTGQRIHPPTPGAAAGPGDGIVRLAGLALAAGPLIWAAGQFTSGAPDPTSDEVPPIELAAGCAFIVGLAALAGLMLATRATGDRKGKALPIIALVLFPFAIATSLGSLPYETYSETPLWVQATDPAWPLSQITMLACAIAVIRVARWKGPLRFLPLAGSLWLLVSGVGEAVTSVQTGTYIFTAWMAFTYVAAGLLLLTKPGAARGL
ncbi:hypothetical protein EDD29_6343 [Actinocorallia herbida]|uniref:Uncharacterized protein n=1 Tax=Actinocorallia herbida TaxID=58109 RepID=A0A3N1D5A9_9ACTN|nr:hypothetical protein [Actinocorallia herbida]ROO88669.1 hypothetical protein EDD29_6343 [Actinocorallia herbida]